MVWPFDLLATRAQVAAVAAQLHDLQRGNLAVLHRLTSMEAFMSELDTSVGDLSAAVDDLATRLQTPSDALAEALARIGELNTQIGELSADDAADAEQISSLTVERDQLLADAGGNVTAIQDVTAKVRGLAPAPDVTPNPEPTPDPEPAPVEDAPQP